MAHITFPPSQRLLQRPITKVDPKAIFISLHPVIIWQKRAFHIDSKLSLETVLSEETLMHFHIKLILPLRKNENSIIVHAKRADCFQLFHKCLSSSGKGKDVHVFHFLFFGIAQGLKNLNLHVLPRDTLQGWKGWVIPKHTIHNTDSMWMVCARINLVLAELPTIK